MAELSKKELEQVVDAYLKYGKNKLQAAKSLGIPESTFRFRLKKATSRGMLPLVGVATSKPQTELVKKTCVHDCFEVQRLMRNLEEINKELNYLKKERITSTEIRSYLFGLRDAAKQTVPDWVIGPKDLNMSKLPKEIPSLVLSDFHFGEVVKASQVIGKNEYNIEIAKERVRLLTKNTTKILKYHLLRNADYPGIVLLFAGDMLAGDIHEELTATNDSPVMPTFLELFQSCINLIINLQKEFGKIMIFGSPGNHTRTTKRIQFKDMSYTNFDWLLYNLLEMWFTNNVKNDNINFYIPDSEDVHFQIYNHKFRLAHGHRFRGGQGFVGPLAPITRGEIKKRAAAYTYGENYDTLVIGHYHQYMILPRAVVNGSLVGYNEFAMQNDFPYEPPKQAMFLVHPHWGITTALPVFCTEMNGENQVDQSNWVSWKES